MHAPSRASTVGRDALSTTHVTTRLHARARRITRSHAQADVSGSSRARLFILFN